MGLVADALVQGVFRLSRAPDFVLPALIFLSTRATTEAISSISVLPIPSVETAAAPKRRPLVYQGPLASNGTGLRLRVIPHRRTASSAWRPVMPWVEATSRTSKWLSVPPVSTFRPSCINASARARALATMSCA